MHVRAVLQKNGNYIRVACCACSHQWSILVGVYVCSMLNQDFNQICETGSGRLTYRPVPTSMYISAMQQEELHHVRLAGVNQCEVVVSTHIGVVL